MHLFGHFTSLRSAPRRARFVFSPLFCPRPPRPASNGAPVNVQFADAGKSSGSLEAACFLLKFPRKFPQIIVLTSLVSTSTLSPRLVLFPFSRPPPTATRGKFWIFSLMFHLMSFPYLRYVIHVRYGSAARNREARRSAALSEFQKEKNCRIIKLRLSFHVVFFTDHRSRLTHYCHFTIGITFQDFLPLVSSVYTYRGTSFNVTPGSLSDCMVLLTHVEHVTGEILLGLQDGSSFSRGAGISFK